MTKKEQWGMKEPIDNIEKAFGGCKKCYGKGYATVIEFAGGNEDFGGENTIKWQLPRIRFCSCERGESLKKEIALIRQEGYEQRLLLKRRKYDE